MIDIQVTNDGLERLAKAIENTKYGLTQEVQTALWNAGKRVQRACADAIREELNVPLKRVRQAIKIKRGKDFVWVVIHKEGRLSLKYFKPRQTKAGTTVRISRKRGAKNVPGAFMGPKPGVLAQRLNGNVFRREGKARKPIYRPKGPSPWGVFIKNNMSVEVLKVGHDVVRHELDKRIRFHNLKRGGGLNWQQPEYVSDQATGEN